MQFICKRCGNCCLNLTDAYQCSVDQSDIDLWRENSRDDILEWVDPIDCGERAVGGGNALNSVNLTLMVKIQDKVGNFSNELSFPLSLYGRNMQISSPPVYFKENNLGPIIIRLQPNP